MSNNDVASRLAREFGVSRATIFRDAEFADNVDRLASILGVGFKSRLLDGHITRLTTAGVARLASLDDDRLAALAGVADDEILKVADRLRPSPDRLDACKAAYRRLSAAEQERFSEWLRGLTLRLTKPEDKRNA